MTYLHFSKTYNSDYMVSDSASTAFAMYSGVKTTGYTMGYDNTIEYMNMGSVAEATEVETILDWAQAKGMKTGFVTTTRMSHATPAALYSKTASRFWECEEDIWDDINDGKINETDYKTFKVKRESIRHEIYVCYSLKISLDSLLKKSKGKKLT